MEQGVLQADCGRDECQIGEVQEREAVRLRYCHAFFDLIDARPRRWSKQISLEMTKCVWRAANARKCAPCGQVHFKQSIHGYIISAIAGRRATSETLCHALMSTIRFQYHITWDCTRHRAAHYLFSASKMHRHFSSLMSHAGVASICRLPWPVVVCQMHLTPAPWSLGGLATISAGRRAASPIFRFLGFPLLFPHLATHQSPSLVWH